MENNYVVHGSIESAINAIKGVPKTGEHNINEVLFFGIGSTTLSNDICTKVGIVPNLKSGQTPINLRQVRSVLKYLLEEDETIIEYKS